MASEGSIVLSYHDTLLRQSDVALLEGHRWLNDNIISFWFEYLEHDLYSQYSHLIVFFSPQVAQFIKSAACNENNIADVRAMISSMDLHNKQIIFIPVNDCTTFSEEMGGSHWSLLVYFTSKQSFEHYDSHTGSVNRYHAEHIVSILAPMLITNHVSDIELDMTEMECTQQSNSYDCGVHLICNAEAVCRKYFHADNRHISDISSPSVVSQGRRDIRNLIIALRRKSDDGNGKISQSPQ